ncbi:MAG: PACE efflux transporter [Rhizobacter sp.]|nr:PACE efflux transporter [Rhizobacter sp.]
MTPTVCLTPQRLRSRVERVVQTLWFEAVGLILVTPLFALASGERMGASLLVLAALSATVMAWSAVYNSLVDRIEQRVSGRIASNRPHHWRVLHALGFEVSAVAFTWPLVVTLTSLSWHDALKAEVGLTLAYAAYGYVFHLVFDRLRPVR